MFWFSRASQFLIFLFGAVMVGLGVGLQDDLGVAGIFQV